MNNKKTKGFTLIEILLSTGFISISSIGAYAVANTANDYRKSSTEVKALNALIQQIDNSTSTIESYQSISLSSLNFNSALTLADVQPINKSLNFVYSDVGSRVCNDFTSKMLSSSKNISAIVNKSKFDKENIKDIAIACYQDKNDLTIVLNKELNDYSINTVVASVNLPPPPVPEIEIPTFGPTTAGESWTPPEAFTASTAIPNTYPITSVAPPVFGPVLEGGGSIYVTSPSSPITPSNPALPNWTPPTVVRPPATGHGGDVIDQDPNPPAPPPKPAFYSKTIYVCQTGYTWENSGYSCNNFINNPTIKMTLTLPNQNADEGLVNFFIPNNYHCTSGEAGFQLGYFKTYQEIKDSTYFWEQHKSTMHLNAFNNTKVFIFTCMQTG